MRGGRLWREHARRVHHVHAAITASVHLNVGTQRQLAGAPAARRRHLVWLQIELRGNACHARCCVAVRHHAAARVRRAVHQRASADGQQGQAHGAVAGVVHLAGNRDAQRGGGGVRAGSHRALRRQPQCAQVVHLQRRRLHGKLVAAVQALPVARKLEEHAVVNELLAACHTARIHRRQPPRGRRQQQVVHHSAHHALARGTKLGLHPPQRHQPRQPLRRRAGRQLHRRLPLLVPRPWCGSCCWCGCRSGRYGCRRRSCRGRGRRSSSAGRRHQGAIGIRLLRYWVSAAGIAYQCCCCRWRCWR